MEINFEELTMEELETLQESFQEEINKRKAKRKEESIEKIESMLNEIGILCDKYSLYLVDNSTGRTIYAINLSVGEY